MWGGRPGIGRFAGISGQRANRVPVGLPRITEPASSSPAVGITRYRRAGSLQPVRNDPDGSCGAMAPRNSLTGITVPAGCCDGGGAMRDGYDDRLSDAVALDEIDLYANVLTAVAAADRPLTDDELDAVLGLDDAPRGAPA